MILLILFKDAPIFTRGELPIMIDKHMSSRFTDDNVAPRVNQFIQSVLDLLMEELKQVFSFVFFFELI